MTHFHLGLIGFPLGHSRSPALHRAALEACGLAGSYELFPVPPGAQYDLAALLLRLQRGELHGLNVTIPHKQTVFSLLDACSPEARGIGAVNTIAVEDGLLIGYNTDAEGFRIDLYKRFGLRSGNALVLGAGGAARAIVYALLKDSWSVGLAARNARQAAALAENRNISVLSWPLDRPEIEQFSPDLIVNTTPIGMDPDSGSSPWPAGLEFPPEGCLYDLVYNPPETALVASARGSGLRAASGLGMLIEQAALAFEIWTGLTAPRERMLAAVEE